jgi:hypothetical protein
MATPRPYHRQIAGVLLGVMTLMGAQREALLRIEQQQSISENDLKELERVATAFTDELQRSSDPLRRG